LDWRGELSVGLEQHRAAVLKISHFVNCVQSDLSARGCSPLAMGKFSITLTMGCDMTILPEGLYMVDTPVSASAEGFIERFGSMILMKGMKHKFWVFDFSFSQCQQY
jgi:hypothetical protein